MQDTPDFTPVLPETNVAEAAALVLTQLAQNFDHWLAALMQDDDPLALHKARVAMRRFRVALCGFTAVLHPDLADDLDDRARGLFRMLGRARDVDVMAERFAELRPKAQQMRHKTRKMLIRKNAGNFARLVQKRLAGKSWRKPGKAGKVMARLGTRTLAHEALDRAWAACLSNGTHLENMTARAQHELRKDLKTLRYLSEFFSVLWPDAPLPGFLRDMRGLQDDLGLLNDQVVAAAHGLPADNDGTHATRHDNAARAWLRVQKAGKWWDQQS